MGGGGGLGRGSSLTDMCCADTNNFKLYTSCVFFISDLFIQVRLQLRSLQHKYVYTHYLCVCVCPWMTTIGGGGGLGRGSSLTDMCVLNRVTNNFKLYTSCVYFYK